MAEPLPETEELYRALCEKDSAFEGIFVFAVKTTGIFCRPTCRARKPKRENVEFFKTPQEAMDHGYRPCKLCRPMDHPGDIPRWLRPLFDHLESHPDVRLRDRDLADKGLDPTRVRRWFQRHRGMTFHAFQRSHFMGKAHNRIRHGDTVINAAFDAGYDSLSGFNESFKKSTGFSPVQSRKRDILSLTRLSSPLGPMIAGSVPSGICLLDFADHPAINDRIQKVADALSARPLEAQSPHLGELHRQLEAYFQGQLKDFDLPLVMTGTPFQQKAWSVLKTISYGRTLSYKEQALRIGGANLVRAVAAANSRNRIVIVIPCHRIIGSSGNLTGYSGGLWRKRYLLDLEAGPARTKNARS